MKPELETFAERARDYVDSIGDQDAAVAAVRERLRRTGSRSSAGLSLYGGRMVWVGVLVGMLALAGSAAWWRWAQRPLTAWVEAVDVPLDGRLIQTEHEMKQLQFSDGTELSLHPDTSLSVREPSARGALIVLERGRTLARVQHSGSAEYRFLAGPFRVTVTGTAFDLGWSADQRVFELALHEGSVMLEGPTLAKPRLVGRGEFVRIELAPSDEAAAAHPTAVSPPPASPQEAGTAPDPKVAVRATEPTDAGDALTRATRVELLSIAEAARHAGRPRQAAAALEAVRRRYGERGQSAYLLGKIHADQLHAPGEGIRWFETYLDEAPGGPMAEVALGRLVELRAGTERGRQLAQQYIDTYPKGAYAAFARAQLGAARAQ